MKPYVVSSGSVGATNDNTNDHCDNKKRSVSIQLALPHSPHVQQHGGRGCERYVIGRYHGYENALLINYLIMI